MTHSLKARQKQAVLDLPNEDFSSYEDWKEVTLEPSEEDIFSGKRLLKEGKVACLLLAGGQGSRLGDGVVKGKVEVSVVEKKSLFQIFFEKILYAGRQSGRKLPVAVMTSAYNFEEIREYLFSRDWFGLSEKQVYFFLQENLPFCDKMGEWIGAKSGDILQGPDGNGLAFHRMDEAGIVRAFQDLGVEHVNVVQIDNPLADPFDPSFIGFHHRKRDDISIIAVRAEAKGEKAGALASHLGACRIIEYTENLGHRFSFLNTGLFCFSLKFIQKIARANVKIPWHLAYKKIAPDLFGWKFEYFLFDLFCYAENISVLIKPRNECFSPLKNAVGDKSLKTVKEDLLRKDKAKYETLMGEKAPFEKIELSLALYYPKGEEKVKVKEIIRSTGIYIVPEVL